MQPYDDYTTRLEPNAYRHFGKSLPTARSLLAAEIKALGFEVEFVQRYIIARMNEKSCIIYDSDTSFSSRICWKMMKDKQLTRKILRKAEVSYPKGKVYDSSEYENARKLVVELRSVVVKPINGNKGRGVSVNVTIDDFELAWRAAEAETNSKIIVEEYFSDSDEARYLVVDGHCAAVVQRIPPFVIGDGLNSIAELIDSKNKIRTDNPDLRGNYIKLDGYRCEILKRQGVHPDVIPAVGRKIVIDWKSNISLGAETRAITDLAHPSMKQVAERVANAVPGSHVIGVDIMARNHAAEAKPRNYVVIEANTRPGILMYHFPLYGKPTNVCRLIAQSCAHRLGIELCGVDDSKPSVEYSLANAAAPTVPPSIVGAVPKESVVSGADFTLVIGGDTSLGGSYIRKGRSPELIQRLDFNQLSFFEKLVPLLTDKHHLMLNLETVLPNGELIPATSKKWLNWDNPRQTITTLQGLAVDSVSLANNHTMDFGIGNLLGTASWLNEADIKVLGAGESIVEASKPNLVSTKFGSIYIFSGMEYRSKYDRMYHYYADTNRSGINFFGVNKGSRFLAEIRSVRLLDPSGIIMVFPHWGGGVNYGKATHEMVYMNWLFLKAGADLVLGHGSHTIQRLHASSLGTSCFSLGNFVFNSPGRYSKLGAPPYSLICRLTLSRAAAKWCGTLKLYPIVSDNLRTGYRPRRVREEEARDVYQFLRQHGDQNFERVFDLDRDERGWFITRNTPLSPRFAATTRSARHHSLGKESIRRIDEDTIAGTFS